MLFTSMTLISFNNALAQKFYAGIHSSYHFPTGGSLNGYFNAESSSLSSTLTVQKVNFGKGLQSGLTVGYMFMKNIGLELSIDKAFKQKLEFSNSYRPSWTGTYLEKLSFTTSSILLSPSLIVKTDYKDVNVYSKLGLLILKGSQHNTYYENNNTHITDKELDIKRISGIGLKCALGTLIKVSKSIDLQFEVNTSNITASPKSQIITKFIEDGVDKLPTMTVSEKEAIYVDEFTVTATPAPTNEPDQALKVYLPFNNVGALIGIVFKF